MYFPRSCRKDQTSSRQNLLVLAHRAVAWLRQDVLQPFPACHSKVLLHVALLTHVSVLLTCVNEAALQSVAQRSVERSSSHCWFSALSPVI